MPRAQVGDIVTNAGHRWKVVGLNQNGEDATIQNELGGIASAPLWACTPVAGDCVNIETVLRRLVELKDGPRDADYRSKKEQAWSDARFVLGLEDQEPQEFKDGPTTASRGEF